MEAEEDTINSKYIIKSKKGSGGTASVFLVKPINENITYAAKVLKSNKAIIKEMNDNEVKYLTILKDQHCPYIIEIIDSGEGPILRKEKNDGEPAIRKYIILENCEKRELADYIIYTHEGLGEKFSKLMFYKIMKGILVIHDKEICHKDIKLENILLDDKFNPKIVDFGLATKNSSELKDFENGTLPYLPPELLEQKPYNGKKLDIFSLGATIIYLITGNSGFDCAVKECEMYKKIMDNDIEKYWEIVEGNFGQELSKDFKDLYFKMISYDPDKRLDAHEIMKHAWLKEITEMNEEEIKELENDVKQEFIYRENKIQDYITDETEEKDDEEFYGDDRGIGDEGEEYFNLNHIIKEKPANFNMAFCIKIKGNISPNSFMNNLCKKINEKFDDCKLKPDKKKLKFSASFGDEDEEEKKYLKKEIVKMKVKLYREQDELLLLKFIKVNGSKKNFFDKFHAISELIKNKNDKSKNN